MNIAPVATLREARYRGKERGEPDVIEAALICVAAGAHGITAHLREDRRHIQDRDIWHLREALKVRLNLEMANSPEIIEIALRVKPDIICLVPEKRQELTTEGGLNAAAEIPSLTETTKRMNGAGIEVSLFIDPDPAQVEASAKIGAQFIELHTGPFAEHFNRKKDRAFETERLARAASLAHDLGLQVNAGHGLTTQNVPGLFEIPHLVELNIGHHIVSRSITVGLAMAVKEMLLAMERYPHAPAAA